MIKSIDPLFYLHFASKLFNKPVDDITEEELSEAITKFIKLSNESGDTDEDR